MITYTIEEAQEEIEFAPSSIEEALLFASREQYTTAIGILTSVTRTVERIAQQYPQFNAELKPIIQQATTATMRIIREAK